MKAPAGPFERTGGRGRREVSASSPAPTLPAFALPDRLAKMARGTSFEPTEGTPGGPFQARDYDPALGTIDDHEDSGEWLAEVGAELLAREARTDPDLRYAEAVLRYAIAQLSGRSEDALEGAITLRDAADAALEAFRVGVHAAARSVGRAAVLERGSIPVSVAK